MNVPVDITNVTLETPRLRLRPFEIGDLEDFYAYASVPGVGEMAGWAHHETIDDTRYVLNIFMQSHNVFAIVEKESGRVIGSLGLHESWASQDERFRDERVVELGYVLSRDWWGRALMPEAVRAVIAWCFESLQLDSITIGHFIENTQSRRVIEKCGFTYVMEADYEARSLHRCIREARYRLQNPARN